MTAVRTLMTLKGRPSASQSDCCIEWKAHAKFSGWINSNKSFILLQKSWCRYMWRCLNASYITIMLRSYVNLCEMLFNPLWRNETLLDWRLNRDFLHYVLNILNVHLFFLTFIITFFVLYLKDLKTLLFLFW